MKYSCNSYICFVLKAQLIKTIMWHWAHKGGWDKDDPSVKTPTSRCQMGRSDLLFICYHSSYAIAEGFRLWPKKQDEKAEIRYHESNANGQIVLTWIPSRREWSVRIAGHRESLPLSASQSSLTTDPQTGRRKEKGRVCLGEEGDSKEEAKGEEQIRGVACTQHWPNGRWEELKNPIAYGGGQGVCKGGEISGTDWELQPVCCKGVWLP